MIGSKSGKELFTSTGLMPQEEMLAIKPKGQTYTIGIPKEEDKNENRVAITPLTVDMLVKQGHKIYVQTQAGLRSNFSDHDYSERGALICESKSEVFQCDLLMKVSPPTDIEIGLMKERQTLISILHHTTQNAKYIKRMSEKKITALAYEFIKDINDCYPIVRSMSEIAGSTAILIASEYLSNVHEGKGEMLGGITGVNPSEVIILGAGTAAEFAAKTAVGLGAIVKVFDSSNFKLKRLQNNVGQKVFTSSIIPEVLTNSLKTADVVIGAIRNIGNINNYVLAEEQVKIMKKGSVIIDISIDQGGCIETSRLTSHLHPIFVKHGVIHYCVPNIPSRVSRTASYALSNIFASIISEIGYSGGIKELIKHKPENRSGVYLYEGILTNAYLGKLYDIPSQDLNLLIGAF